MGATSAGFPANACGRGAFTRSWAPRSPIRISTWNYLVHIRQPALAIYLSSCACSRGALGVPVSCQSAQGG